MPVDSFIKRIFGTDSQFESSKVLLIGSGGIGCELLKDLIMMDYGEIHVLDLDTIDLSNLNRQFLFRKKDIKAPKSLTAVKAVQNFSYNAKLVAHQGNIMDKSQFPLSFFEKFDMIFNALDNLEARMYVNKVCLFSKIPLIESGTAGLKGQVQPIYPYITECFACVPKSTPKAFPVCTIRSTPSRPVHCVTWAKSFLFPQLFGPDDPDLSTETDENPSDEKKASLQEANELLKLKRMIQSAKSGDDYSYIDSIITKIFTSDIKRLLRMDNLWKSRQRPTPLDYSGSYMATIHEFESQLPQNAKFSDQVEWSIIDNLKVFASSTLALTKRLSKVSDIDFDKDDPAALGFVASASNIRSYIFDIPQKTEFQVKQIAGNIIPAVATTNALMAGFSSLSSIHYFLNGRDMKKAAEHSRMVCDSSSSERIVNSSRLAPPNPSCKQCSLTRGIAELDIHKTTLSDLRKKLIDLYKYEDDVSIATSDSRLLYDFDFDDNLSRSVSDFIKSGDVLLISDSEEHLDNIELMVLDKPGEFNLPRLDIPLYKEESPDESGSELEPVETNGVISLDDDTERKRPYEGKESDAKRVKGGESIVILD